MQVGGEIPKPSDRVRIPIRTDRDIVHAVADVNPGRVWMHHVQAWVVGPKLPAQFFPLLSGESEGAASGGHGWSSSRESDHVRPGCDG